MNQNNLYQVMSLIKNSSNPQQMLNGLMQSGFGNNPIGKNVLNLAQKGDYAGIESIARNMCAERGLDFNKEFSAFKSSIGIK